MINRDSLTKIVGYDEKSAKSDSEFENTKENLKIFTNKWRALHMIHANTECNAAENVTQLVYDALHCYRQLLDCAMQKMEWSMGNYEYYNKMTVPEKYRDQYDKHTFPSVLRRKSASISLIKNDVIDILSNDQRIMEMLPTIDKLVNKIASDPFSFRSDYASKALIDCAELTSKKTKTNSQN